MKDGKSSINHLSKPATRSYLHPHKESEVTIFSTKERNLASDTKDKIKVSQRNLSRDLSFIQTPNRPFSLTGFNICGKDMNNPFKLNDTSNGS